MRRETATAFRRKGGFSGFPVVGHSSTAETPGNGMGHRAGGAGGCVGHNAGDWNAHESPSIFLPQQPQAAAQRLHFVSRSMPEILCLAGLLADSYAFR